MKFFTRILLPLISISMGLIIPSAAYGRMTAAEKKVHCNLTGVDTCLLNDKLREMAHLMDQVDVDPALRPQPSPAPSVPGTTMVTAPDGRQPGDNERMGDRALELAYDVVNLMRKTEGQKELVDLDTLKKEYDALLAVDLSPTYADAWTKLLQYNLSRSAQLLSEAVQNPYKLVNHPTAGSLSDLRLGDQTTVNLGGGEDGPERGDHHLQ